MNKREETYSELILRYSQLTADFEKTRREYVQAKARYDICVNLLISMVNKFAEFGDAELGLLRNEVKAIVAMHEK